MYRTDRLFIGKIRNRFFGLGAVLLYGLRSGFFFVWNSLERWFSQIFTLFIHREAVYFFHSDITRSVTLSDESKVVI